jgi:RNA polymerase sigma-70 factor, ECF subfamily
LNGSGTDGLFILKNSFSGVNSLSLALPVAAVATPARSRLQEDVIALFDEFRAPVLRYLLAFRIPVPDAEEIVQEVFLSLFRHLREGKSRANLPCWIFTVAHNMAMRYRIGAKRQSERFADAADYSGKARDVTPNPEDRLEAKERRHRLMAVARALPEQDQCCLALRAEGLRYREIARVLGISVGSVANSLARALGRLSRADGMSR